MLFAQVSMVHIVLARCRQMQVSHFAGCCWMRAHPLPNVAQCEEKFCQMLVESLLLPSRGAQSTKNRKSSITRAALRSPKHGGGGDEKGYTITTPRAERNQNGYITRAI